MVRDTWTSNDPVLDNLKTIDGTVSVAKTNKILTHNSVPQLIFRCFSTLKQTGAADQKSCRYRSPNGTYSVFHTTVGAKYSRGKRT